MRLAFLFFSCFLEFFDSSLLELLREIQGCFISPNSTHCMSPLEAGRCLYGFLRCTNRLRLISAG